MTITIIFCALYIIVALFLLGASASELKRTILGALAAHVLALPKPVTPRAPVNQKENHEQREEHH